MPICQCNNLTENCFMHTMAFTVKIKTNDFQRKASQPIASETLKIETAKNSDRLLQKADRFFFINDAKLLSD